jgi:hypothetical protein
MIQATALGSLHANLDQLRVCVGQLRDSYGDIPAVRRLTGDVDRMTIDASELDVLPMPTPVITTPPQVTMLNDEPFDSAMWADADDEGLGGYRRGSAR